MAQLIPFYSCEWCVNLLAIMRLFHQLLSGIATISVDKVQAGRQLVWIGVE